MEADLGNSNVAIGIPRQPHHRLDVSKLRGSTWQRVDKMYKIKQSLDVILEWRNEALPKVITKANRSTAQQTTREREMKMSQTREQFVDLYGKNLDERHKKYTSAYTSDEREFIEGYLKLCDHIPDEKYERRRPQQSTTPQDRFRMEIKKKSRLDKYLQFHGDSKASNKLPSSGNLDENNLNEESGKNSDCSISQLKTISYTPQGLSTGKVWHESVMKVLELKGKCSRPKGLEKHPGDMREKLENQSQKLSIENPHECHYKINQRQYIMDAGDNGFGGSKCSKIPSNEKCIAFDKNVKYEVESNKPVSALNVLSLEVLEMPKKLPSSSSELSLNKIFRSGNAFWQRRQLLQAERRRRPESRKRDLRELRASVSQEQAFGPVVKGINLPGCQAKRPVSYFY